MGLSGGSFCFSLSFYRMYLGHWDKGGKGPDRKERIWKQARKQNSPSDLLHS